MNPTDIEILLAEIESLASVLDTSYPKIPDSIKGIVLRLGHCLSGVRKTLLRETGKVSMETVKDCPHCGASTEACNEQTGKGVYTYYDANALSIDRNPILHVACLECGSSSPTIEIWNTRKEVYALV
jgi:predicted nucleic-acid-binding Zn-ribbon protein